MNSICIRLKNGKRWLRATALGAVLVLLAGGANALAGIRLQTVWTVSKSSSVSTCVYPSATTCNTIGAAVSAAVAGDIVVVGPGTYNESVTINVPHLSLFGAQAGIDARDPTNVFSLLLTRGTGNERWHARTDPTKESIVDATGTAKGTAFDVEAGYAVIDGFTIQGGTSGPYGTGISVDKTSIALSTQILNNIIQNNALGVFLWETTANLVEHNLFKTNNVGAAGTNDTNFVGMAGFGIAGYEEYANIITENEFTGNLAAAMDFFQGSFDNITKNTSKNDGTFVVFSGCGWSSFGENSGQNFGAKGFMPVVGESHADAAVDIAQNSYNLLITHNDLEEGKAADYNGVAFTTAFGAYSACFGGCVVSGNTIKRFAGNGIVAEAEELVPNSLSDSSISANEVDDNGNDGILVETFDSIVGPPNSVVDNQAKGNAVFDCADDTIDGGTAGTANIWFNNFGNSNSPRTLCTPREE